MFEKYAAKIRLSEQKTKRFPQKLTYTHKKSPPRNCERLLFMIE